MVILSYLRSIRVIINANIFAGKPKKRSKASPYAMKTAKPLPARGNIHKIVRIERLSIRQTGIMLLLF